MAKTPKDFYYDLDRAKNRSGSCNCFSLAVLFILVLIVIEISVFHFFQNIKVDSHQSVATGGLSEFGGNFTKTDIGGGAFQVIVPQGTLCKAISGDKFSNINCEFSENGLGIDGKLSSFLPANATCQLMPQAIQGKIEFAVSRATIGNVSIPKVLVGAIASTASRTIYDAVPELGLAEVQEIEVKEGIMIITATK